MKEKSLKLQNISSFALAFKNSTLFLFNIFNPTWYCSTFLKFKLRTYFKSFKFHGTLADLHLSSDLSWLLSFILKGLNLATADLT